MRTGRIGVAAVASAVVLGSIATSSVSSAQPLRWQSGIEQVEVTTSTPVGVYGGVEYDRIVGIVHGVIDAREPIEGLETMPTDGDGRYVYAAPIEIIRPQRHGEVVIVEAENRGNPLMIQLFNDFVGGSGPPASAVYPDGFGSAFLFEGRRAYARVSWQTGISPSVPATAQGVGQVIVRDLGRLLRDGRLDDGRSPLGRYRHAILTGWSQGAWFVDTFVAEGFNADPARRRRGVYDGALALSGAGNWLAINQTAADGGPQDPYLRPDRAPLAAREILRRSATDPVFVDIANYTDFYRLRAALGGQGDVDSYHRYDWPAAHGPSFFVTDALVFGVLGCNGGQVVDLNPLDFRPYLRAALVGLEDEIGARVVPEQRSAIRGLPAPSRFTLVDGPPPSELFNPLPSVPTPVPAVDDDGQPIGGVRFPEVDLPLGRPGPVSLPPVSTASITAICGNIGGWQHEPATSITQRWTSAETYAAYAAVRVGQLVTEGYVLPIDAPTMVADAERRYVEATLG